MAKMDDFLKNLQQMDQNQLQALLQSATKNLSPAQQMKIRRLIGNTQALEQLKGKISDADIAELSANIGSPEALDNYLKQNNIQKRLDELI